MTHVDSNAPLNLLLPLKLFWWLQTLKVCLQLADLSFDPWVGKDPPERERLPTPVFLLGSSTGQRGEPGRPRTKGRKDSDTTERLSIALSNLLGITMLILQPLPTPCRCCKGLMHPPEETHPPPFLADSPSELGWMPYWTGHCGRWCWRKGIWSRPYGACCARWAGSLIKIINVQEWTSEGGKCDSFFSQAQVEKMMPGLCLEEK